MYLWIYGHCMKKVLVETTSGLNQIQTTPRNSKLVGEETANSNTSHCLNPLNHQLKVIIWLKKAMWLVPVVIVSVGVSKKLPGRKCMNA